MSSPVEAIHRPGVRDVALSDADVQALLARATRLFAERCAERAERGEPPLAAFPTGEDVTATQAMVAVTAILKAVNVQTFELGLWQAWSR